MTGRRDGSRPGSGGDTILSVRDASVTFDMERGRSRVLDEVSLDIEREEIVGIVGESGSGKSMFASACLDAIVEPGHLTGDITFYPESGDPVDVLDLDRDGLRELRWEGISMVFQGAMNSFNPTLTVRGHFRETLEAHHKSVNVGMERAEQLLTDLYLEPQRVLDSYPHELSGGMQQRALIALSLVLEPEVLVMDEPTAALDLLMQRSILELIEEIKEKYDLTILFITHDLPLVAELANRLVVMYAFEFAEIGPVDEVLASAAHPYTRALLNATPNLRAPLESMLPIEGSSPDPVDVPSGCSYHPRCPLATELCRSADPEYHDEGGGHLAACHHSDRIDEEIPLTTTDFVEADPEVRGEDQAFDDGTAPVVRLDDAEVHFENSSGIFGFLRDDEPVRAVDGVTLDVFENDVIALVGESGCGKTTLGKTAIGIVRPTGGTVEYRGQNVWAAHDGEGDVDIPFRDIRPALQIIHQDPGSAINPYRKVDKSLAEPLLLWQEHLERNDRRERILQMLETVGMTPPEDYANRYPHQLSGGEKQRVALIRALLMNPDLILADEAVSALDVSLRIEMMDLMLELQDEFNTSFIFISHDLSNARYLSEKAGGRIGIMYLGELVEIGPAEEIIYDPRHPYTRALRWATPDLATGGEESEMPMRDIDIPDPVDPPSGCRFHTRCPEAREVCSRESPAAIQVDDGARHEVACFREYDDHEYWESSPITDEVPDGTTSDDASGGSVADD